MKNFSKLMALALAVLMALACLASCGEKPAETTAADTTKVETTAAETTALKTKATETTTKAVTTTKVVTTVETTTAAPIPGRDDPKPAAAHTEHEWAVIPTFTAYAEQKADKTVGYYAYHCRYEGCEAIKDDKVYPTLIQMDFENYDGTFLNYLKEGKVANVGPYNKDTAHTNGNVKDGMWKNANKSQGLFEDFSHFSENEKFTIAYDVLTSSKIKETAYNIYFPSFGKFSMGSDGAARYYFQLGIAGKLTNENKDCLYGVLNFNPVYKIEGFDFKTDQWYHIEYEVTMSKEKYTGINVGDIKADGTAADKIQTFYRGTVVIYATEMARNADGSMVRIGDRTLVTTLTSFDALEEEGKDMNLDLYLVKLFGGSGSTKQLVAALDNFAVYLPGQANDPEPAVTHTEHDWAVIPTFTAYAEQKADKTVGYYAYHCRYEGCEAIKDDKVYPTLIQMDFENYDGTFLNYIKDGKAANVGPFNKDTAQTNGNVKDGMFQNANKSQSLFEDLSHFSDNEKFTMAFDVLTSGKIKENGKNIYFPSFGKYSAAGAGRYYYQLGYTGALTNENKDCLYGVLNFNPVYKINGFDFKTNQWYHIEYEVTMSNEKYNGVNVGDIKADGTAADKIQTFYRGTVVIYATEMARNADGTMVPVGDRTIVTTLNSFDALEEAGKDQNLDQYLVKLFGGSSSKQLVAALDNFAVYLPGQAK